MENFCWEWDVLSQMTAHVDTGQPLPRELFDRMLAARNFQSGLATIGQIESGLFDMLLHSAYDPGGSESPQDVLDAVRREVAVVPRAPYDRFMHSFSHIFAGRLRGWILQLQVGRRALGGRLQRLRGGRRAVAGRGRAVSATRCSRVAAAATPWSRSSRFAGGRPNSTPFCGIMG